MKRRHITPEEYLELDRKAEFKSEYWTGELEPVAPLDWVHSVIVANLVNLFSPHPRDCSHVCASGVRVAAAPFPVVADVVTVSGPPQFATEPPQALLNPTLVCEVSTPETAVADGDRKYYLYASIPSVREYIWISAERIDMRVFTRWPNGSWTMQLKHDLEDTVTLTAINTQFRLADAYSNVEFSDENVGVGYMRPVQF